MFNNQRTMRLERRLRKLHLSGIPKARSPSPLPSPSGRGGLTGNALDNPSHLKLSKRGPWFSLSLRERAGVRGNGPWEVQTAGVLQLALASAALGLALLVQVASAQDALSFLSLSRDQFRSGEEMLRAFAPVSASTRYSIVKFRVDGKTVALGAIVDTNGLALTKASELKKGKLTCWLASDKEVAAELLSVDEDDDVALVRVQAHGLKPIQWAA